MELKTIETRVVASKLAVTVGGYDYIISADFEKGQVWLKRKSTEMGCWIPPVTAIWNGSKFVPAITGYFANCGSVENAIEIIKNAS
jgi:hypothetical protein